jgi:hypothetical protein
MKKLVLLLFMFLTTVYSQESRFFDAPFGGGGGFSPGWAFPKMDALNNKLNTTGYPQLKTGGFYTSGGAGFIYLGFVPGLRIGGMGYGGSTSASETMNGINKEVDYSLSGGGFTVEYTLPFVRDVGISVGTVIGGGSLKVEFYKNYYEYNWNNLPGNADTPNETNISPTISNSFWFISPTLNVDIPLYRFLVFRLGAGYQFTFADKWTADNDRSLSGVPSDFNGKSFFIQSGIFIGFFSF